jgi:transposase
MHPLPALGIDLSRLHFDAALLLDGSHPLRARFENHAGGFRKLRTWLKRHGLGQIRVAMEATNTYGEPLLQWAYDQGWDVFLLNPERVLHYARSLGQRNKTDRADALTIARFIAVHEATPWRPLPPQQKTLRSLMRTRYQLVQTQKNLANQLRTAEPMAGAYLKAVLEELKQQLRALGRALQLHLRQFPDLAQQVRRLMTLKGVGLVTAATVLAEVPPITAQTDPRTICAWAGLTPRRRQSANNEWRSFLSRQGNTYLRHALYMPALVAKRHNPVLRQFAERLALNKKTNPAILGAISHKMLRILVGLLRSQTDFDPNWSPQKS